MKYVNAFLKIFVRVFLAIVFGWLIHNIYTLLFKREKGQQ